MKPIANQRGNLAEFAQQALQFRERQGIRSVREGFCGIVMHFEENAIHTHRNARPGERLDKFRLSTAGFSSGTGKLHGVSRIEDHGKAELFHLRVAESVASSRHRSTVKAHSRIVKVIPSTE